MSNWMQMDHKTSKTEVYMGDQVVTNLYFLVLYLKWKIINLSNFFGKNTFKPCLRKQLKTMFSII